MSAFNFGRRTTAAVASGVVLGLTALTGGITPAAAAPDEESGTPPTTTAPAAPTSTTVVPTETPAPAETALEAPTPAEVSPTDVAPTPEPAETAAVVPAPVAPAEPTATVAPAEPAPPTTTTAAPSTTETTTTVPAAPARGTTPATTPTTASEPITTGEAEPAATATPATTTAPARPATVAEAPPPSVAVREAAAPNTPAERRSAPTVVAPKSDADPTPVRESTDEVEPTPPALVQEVLAPQTLEAPEQDVVLAKSVKPIERKPDPAPQEAVAELVKAIDLAQPVGAAAEAARTEGARIVRTNAIAWDRNIRQWSPNWVRYDEYYRPVIANPYRDPVRIVYVYQNRPRVVVIPPLQSVVMEVAQLAAYSFTAVVTNAVNTAVNVAVGSFFGGGYIPAVGLPLPPPPRPVLRYDNVPIQVRYSSATYEPFVVRQIVDVGDDPQYGGHKVLLDGVTPVWGQWVQNPTGQRQFEVYKTQQFPGLDAPAEAPLPGDYRLRLAAETVGPDVNDTNKYLAIAAVTAAGLSLGLVGLSVYLGRRRPLV